MRRFAGAWLLERLLDLAGLEELEDVAHLDVLVALEHDAALEALIDLLNIVLEAAQRSKASGPDDRAVADQADLGDAGGLAVGHQAAGDRADARGAEELLDLRLTEGLLDLLGLQHPLQCVVE